MVSHSFEDGRKERESMIIYLLAPLLLTIFFELIGRTIADKFNGIDLLFYFPLGFFACLCLTYPLLFITINDLSFYLFLIIVLLLGALALFFIIKNIRVIKKKVSWQSLLFLLAIALFLTYYSVNTTLGDLNGFDSSLYLNFVTNNIANPKFNSKDIFFNGPTEVSLTYYSGQVYYYLAGVVVYIFGKLATLLRIEYYYATTFIWAFQILFNLTFAALLLEGFKSVKEKYSAVLPFVLICIFFGRVYFNNVYGFFGNSWLTLAISYGSLFLYRYFKTQEDKYRYLFYLHLLAGCSLSSSGIYILIFALFAFFFFNYQQKGLFREYAWVALLPLINALNMERLPAILVYCLPLTISLLFYFVGQPVVEFMNKHKLIMPFLFLCFLLTFVASRFYSSGLWDFSGLLNNLSQRYDMTINYFYLEEGKHLINSYKLFVLVVFGLVCCLEYKNPYIRFCLILIVVFFNPFCCNVLNHFINVYYRAYVLMINPFSLFIYYDLLANRFKIKYLSIVLVIVVLLMGGLNKPIYYHFSHMPKQDYDMVYKMNKSEMEVIRELKGLFEYYDEDNPYIITGNLLTQSMLPQGRYLYGRAYYVSKNWSEAEKALYGIFYTPQFLGDYLVEDPDYDHMAYYLQEAAVDFLVVDKRVEYYDPIQDNYYSLVYKVNNECQTYPVYENDIYVIYHFE